MKKPPAILIVEDTKIIAHLLGDLFIDVINNAIIHFASDFDEGKKILDDYTPDVVILKMDLPGKSGIEFLSLIKENNIQVKVLIFTNEPSAYHEQLCLSMGADYFFDRSHDFEKIPEILSLI